MGFALRRFDVAVVRAFDMLDVGVGWVFVVAVVHVVDLGIDDYFVLDYVWGEGSFVCVVVCVCGSVLSRPEIGVV